MKEKLKQLRERLSQVDLKANAKKALLFISNPRLLLCFGIGWLITNGWAYILLAVGTWLNIEWMMAVSGAYLAFLWVPFTPEKIITCAIALALLRWLFPGDKKTLAVLRSWYEKARAAITRHRERKAEEKAEGQADEQTDDPGTPSGEASDAS